MNKVRQLRPSGARGSAIRAAATALTVGLALLGGCGDPSDPDGQRPKTQTEVADTARAVKETAMASAAIVRLNQVADGDNSTVVPVAPDPSLVPDPTVALPGDGDGIGELFGDLIEGLFGF